MNRNGLDDAFEGPPWRSRVEDGTEWRGDEVGEGLKGGSAVKDAGWPFGASDEVSFELKPSWGLQEYGDDLRELFCGTEDMNG